MKKGIHPEYKAAKITCVCGNAIQTHSTAGDYEIQICSKCHPFFTGKQKFVDTAGRVERFQRRYAKMTARKHAPAGEAGAAEAAAGAPQPPAAEPRTPASNPQT